MVRASQAWLHGSQKEVFFLLALACADVAVRWFIAVDAAVTIAGKAAKEN